VAAIASGQRVSESLADCDSALRLLRILARSGTVEERLLARRSIDHVLDRRNRIMKRNGGL
jgi:hypothetical protein